MPKTGRPRTARARKFEKLSVVIGCNLGTIYHYISGTRRASYETGQCLHKILGGGLDLWCMLGNKTIKKALFDAADLKGDCNE